MHDFNSHAILRPFPAAIVCGLLAIGADRSAVSGEDQPDAHPVHDARPDTGEASLRANLPVEATRPRPRPRGNPPAWLPKPPRKPSGPKFVGIELGPGILGAIRHKTRIDDWSQAEIDAYYEVLAHARRTDYQRQKDLARRNRLADIEAFRSEAEVEYRRTAERLQKLKERNPGKAAVYDRRLTQARRLRDRKLTACEQYQQSPGEFPTFVRMFKSVGSDDPGRYHGRLVTLSGYVRKLVSYRAGANEHGIERLYEAWLYTPKSQSIPAVVVCTSIPEGMPTGEGRDYSQPASVTGYFFKMYAYTDQNGTARIAPMILADRLEWRRREAGTSLSPWIMVSIGGVAALLAGAFVWTRIRDRRARRRLRGRLVEEAPVFDPPTERL